MQWLWYTLASFVIIFLTLYILSYFQGKKSSVKLEAEEFKNQMRKGQLVDCRTKREFDSGHINGARNLNIQTLSREYQKLRKDQPIYLYCATGKRSSRAAIYLKARGYGQIYELKDGLKSWNGQLK